jgi:hypothetical protein
MSRWLLLAHQLPTKSSNARVKTWRRLQDVGAVAVRNSVYVLPNTDACREDFEWIRSQVVALGGGATVFEADSVDRSSDVEIEEAFRRARNGDYLRLAKDAKAIGKGVDPRGARMLAERLASIQRIDFFHAPAHDTAADAVAAVKRRVAAAAEHGSKEEHSMRTSRSAFINRRWVTRPRPGVDRMASAWLIRRFIDPEARFKFVAARGYRPESGELRFDMYQAEYTHEGASCTFEVLLDRFGLRDPALRVIGEIVHDIDCKDARFERPETAGIAALLAGIVASVPDDEQRLHRSAAALENLLRHFSTPHRA